MDKNWGDMYDYILESSDTVKKIIDERNKMDKAVEYAYQNDIKRIVVLGSGTSYHAAISARRAMEEILQIPTEAVYPLTFKDDRGVIEEKTLVIGISQYGHSTSTILALDYAKEHGLPTIALTELEEAPLCKHADAFLPLNCGEEKAGPKTKGFIGSIANLAVFACQLALKRGVSEDKVNAMFNRLISSSENISDIAVKSKDFVLKHMAELKACKRLVIVGYEGNLGAVSEGSLKILEGVRVSVTGYQMEEFYHGIYHSIYENDYIIYLGSKSEYIDRMKKMYRYFKEERNAHQFVITSDESFKDNDHAFVYDFKDDRDFSSMEYVVPLQIITKFVSMELGIDANIPSDPKFHEKMGSYV